MSKNIPRRQLNLRVRNDYLDEFEIYCFNKKKNKYEVLEEALQLFFVSKGIPVSDIGKKRKERKEVQVEEREVLANQLLASLIQEANLLFKEDEEVMKCLKLKRRIIRHMQKEPVTDEKLKKQAEVLIEQLNEAILEEKEEIPVVKLKKVEEDGKDLLADIKEKVKEKKNE